MSSSHSDATTVLLPDAAVRVCADYIWPLDDLSTDGARAELIRDTRAGLEALLRYNATEGREALVETVKAVFDERFPYISRDLPVNTMSEAIVDALFGRPE